MTFRVEIAGGIAAGKTTLCEALRARGFSIISERLEENLFLERAYANKGARGFDVGMAFMLSKASAIDTYEGPSPIAVVDYAMVSEYAYNDAHLKAIDPQAHDVVRQAIDLRRRQLGDPDILIHLHCSAEHQMANIKKRGRDFEQGHKLEYLQAINDGIKDAVTTRVGAGCKILSFDTGVVDVGHPKFIGPLVKTILNQTVNRSAIIQNPAPRP